MCNPVHKTDKHGTTLFERWRRWGQSPGTGFSMVVPESLCGILRFENHWFKAVVLKPLHTSESPGELAKAHCWVPLPVALWPEFAFLTCS